MAGNDRHCDSPAELLGIEGGRFVDQFKGPIAMEWTFANLIIQTVAGLIGANIAAAAAHEHRFGFLGHSLVGLVTGALAGIFLQKYASTVVTANGSLNDPTGVQIVAAQVLTGAVTGAIAMMATGFIIKERSRGE
jgi:hypothetical protein